MLGLCRFNVVSIICRSNYFAVTSAELMSCDIARESDGGTACICR